MRRQWPAGCAELAGMEGWLSTVLPKAPTGTPNVHRQYKCPHLFDNTLPHIFRKWSQKQVQSHMAYDAVSDVVESGGLWRSDFQIGSRVLTRSNWARKVREFSMFNVHVQFNVLCTVYCGRGCVNLESENFADDGTTTTTEISGVLRGPRGPKKTSNLVFVGFPYQTQF